MEPVLFDIENGEVRPTKHCYTINCFKEVIDEYGVNAGKIFACIHYTLSLNPETNPYANLQEENRWDTITSAVAPELDLNLENNIIVNYAIQEAAKIYSTSAYRIYLAFKNLLDKLAVQINSVNIDLTKDQGNMAQIKTAISSYKDLKAAHNESFEEFMKGFTNVKSRGDGKTSYDSDFDEELE